jgi:transcriptional regulator with XRE-family HTH domain
MSMGYFGKLEEKFLAQKLRKQGLSYKEILQQVSVSKDTISRWCKDIKLTNKQKLRLMNNKKFGQRKGSLVAAENKREERIAKTKKLIEKGKIDVGKLSHRDRFIAGIALYAAEGDKTDRRVGFANSDPNLIKFMMAWFTEFAHTPLPRMHGGLYLHENLDETMAKKFWSRLTKIPINQFHKVYIVKNKKGNIFKKNIHKYGVFSIRMSDSPIHRQIMGWIYALFNDKI